MPTSLALLPRAVRRAAAAAALLLAALPGRAAAQTVTVGYAPICGATPCSTLRFSLANTGGSTLLFNTLGFTASAASGVTFAPADPGNPAVGSFEGRDAVDVLGGSTTIGASGRSVFIDFLADVGFAFQLDAGTRGFVDLDAASSAPTFAGSTFTFAATYQGGGSASGAVGVAPAAVVPEPATFALVAGGVAVLAAGVRRRRAA